MNVELPTTGCNIINSDSSFYNYHDDGQTRDTYIIYNGKAIKQNTTTSQFGYNYPNYCLTTGDLVYKPELKGVWFPIVSIITFAIIVKLIINLFRGRL